MTFDFDRIVERRGTCCLKYDFAEERGRPADLLPFWVADMDFAVPPVVKQALLRCAEHGIFGYTEAKAPYYEALSNWYEERFGFGVRPEWVVKTPGVVVALAVAVQAFTQPGDAVLLQRPVYYPFSEVIADNGRRVVSNSLVQGGGRYEMNLEDFERCIRQHRVKLFLLCSPHNPVGRVWSREELLAMGQICAKHDVTVVADEIHCDLVYEGRRHTVFPSLSQALAQRTVLCGSAAKSFNLAGLQVSNVIIPNAGLRRRFQKGVDAIGYSQCNTMGLAATEAAYRHGGAWLAQLLAYLQNNLRFCLDFFAERLPQITPTVPEGTYLLWLDMRRCGVPAEELRAFLTERAGLWLDDGDMFGPEGFGFQRLNFACPRSVLERGLRQLEQALRHV
jgi:cystathionine beta-lyase